MKLKNSYILLIVMALFLLVSIGSACAADTGTSDAGILTDGNSSQNTIEKIDTTVESENVKVYENDPVEIPVAVKDNESKEINIAKENITVTEGNKTINFNYNNSKINIADKLEIGNHSLNINYLGNEIYKNSTKNVLLSIFGDIKINVPSVVSSDGKTVEIPISLSNGVDQITPVKDNLTLNMRCTGDDGNSTSALINEFTLENNTIRFALDNLKYVGISVNVNYTGAKESKDVLVKYATLINASAITVSEDEDKNITISVVSNGDKLNIVENNLKIIEGTKELKFKYANDIVTITDPLTRGKHNIIVKYLGNNTYYESSKNITVSVYGNLTIDANPTALDINSTKKGKVNVNVTNGLNNTAYTADDITLNVTKKNGNDTVTINVKSFDVNNGTISFELESGDFSSANLTITYKNKTSKTITLNRIFNAKIEALVTSNEYKNGAFKFKLTDIDDSTVSLKGKSVSLYTVGNIRAGFSATLDESNTVSFLTKNLYEFDNTNNTFEMREFEVGKHQVEISTTGDIKTTKLDTNLTITKATINIKIANFKEEVGTDKNVTITVTNKKSGEVVPGIILHLYMPETTAKDYYFQTDSNGQSKVSVKNLIGGTYNISVNNNDTKNINKAKASDKITLVPKKAVINTKSVTVMYNTGTTATIKITDKKTGKALPNVIIVVQLFTGKKSIAYPFATNKKGIVQFAAPLSVGKHKMVVQTADANYEASKVVKYITVKKATAKFKAPKLTTYYKGGKYFTVTLKNAKNNKPIYDAKVNIKVFVSSNRYYNYKGNTGGNGQIRLALDNLKPGSYKVEVSKLDSKNYTAKGITSKIVIKKAPTKLTPKKVSAKKGAKKYFQVTVKNTKTKKVIKGVKLNLKVYTGKKYKTYTVKSNSKGIAKLNVKSLTVGTHKVVVKSANKYCVAKAAKSTIKITK